MADQDEVGDKLKCLTYKKPLELFEERKVVRMCAPMVRYSK